MNRRGFLTALAGGFAVLPSALTYKRLWRATETGILTPQDSDFHTYCFRFVAGANGSLWKVEKWECGTLRAKFVTVKELPVGIIPHEEIEQWKELSVEETIEMIDKTKI